MEIYSIILRYIASYFIDHTTTCTHVLQKCDHNYVITSVVDLGRLSCSLKEYKTQYIVINMH